MFCTLYDTYFQFLNALKMSSAIFFNVEQSKILSSGNELNNLCDANKSIRFAYVYLSQRL